MLKRISVFLAAALLAIPAVAGAQFQAGDREVTLSGSGSSDNDFDNTIINVQGSFGHFFSDMLEGIIRQELLVADSENDSSWNGSTALGADLNFNLGTWVPVVGATLGYIYGDAVDETWFAAPEAGLKAFVNNTTFIQGLVQYQWFFDSGDEADNNFDDGRFVYSLGLGFRF